jgi:hypothetical protein
MVNTGASHGLNTRNDDVHMIIEGVLVVSKVLT